ncbi:hypothetical protein GCM10010972_34610 [Cellulomonas carbonis]|uniref:Flagellar protein FliL n=2 Tax=Cellulomonas carbonis TaxID=1386092 RepID=A0A0A0BSE9_9CELL|nr:flagellar basal body-associated FliL family protein [Cellulomonas carbonis]KGM10074.1 flagellar basal body-associated protein FliL [Cellulomonas carbonis T26]GGC18433.1 hypothetical protein GCM10010972_34610 [Cellulomonas carbonis]
MEQRIIAEKPKIGARPPHTEGAAEQSRPSAAPTGPRRRRILALALVITLTGGTGYWFVARPALSSTTEEAPPMPGEILPVEPINLNLADGRYLRLGFALQLTAEVEEDLEPARALDIAIDVFSGRTLEEVTSPEGRQVLKDLLAARVQESYDGQVMSLYITEFVTQ